MAKVKEKDSNSFPKKNKIAILLIIIVVIILLCVGSISIGNLAIDSVEEITEENLEEVAQDDTKEEMSVEVEETQEEEAEEEAEEEEIIVEVNRKSEIETAIRRRVREGDYVSARLVDIRVNDDFGSDDEGYYIALVNFEYDIANRRTTANEMMKMYSDDLVATLANQDITDITEAVIFWEDSYNNRDLKYAYEYRNGRFYITEIVGE